MSLAEAIAPMKKHSSKQQTAFYEQKIGRTWFRVTSIYKDNIDLTQTLEGLIVKKILDCEDRDIEEK